MGTLSLRPYIPSLIHMLLWVLLGNLLLLYPPLSWQSSLQVVFPVQFWVKQSILFCLLIAIFYANARLWAPRLLFQNHTTVFVAVVVAVSVLLVLLVQMIDSWLNLPELMHKAIHPDGDVPMRERKRFDVFILLMALLVLGISTSITAVQKWQKDTQLRKDLEQQKVSSELSFLKAQINPHFFFNTLNNIYALTLINVELARQALHKLSRMMRYVLYETQRDMTLLSQEIDFIQDYITLMQLRLTDNVKVSFEQPSSLNDTLIAPMLLLPFVENAFKHGVSVQEPSHIRIAITQNNALLQMEVRNTIFTKKSLMLDDSHGIGLVNTKRRLDLLYPDQHMLTAKEDPHRQEYNVHLTLHLS